ncbi:BA14K family protein [Aureimonas ureilytica]|uniref:BA14K family protein n=1 Tax=Aureimonas ureilytica TaxID=401562 RepID=UPI0003663BF5|nr:BA14K family protein [Aureimonas ureilytica]
MRILLAVLTACTLTTSLGTAQAQVWDNGPGYIGEPPPPPRGYYREAPRRHHRGGIDAGDALLGGAIGLAAGALLGSALSQPQQAPAPTYDPPRQSYPAYGVAPPSYEDTVPARRTYRQPRQARYYDDYGTNTRQAHVDACFARYRSYDARTDTYIGNDGYRHRCNIW